MPAEIQALTDKLLHNPARVEVTPVSSTVDIIDASLYYVDKENKRSLLVYLLNHEGHHLHSLSSPGQNTAPTVSLNF